MVKTKLVLRHVSDARLTYLLMMGKMTKQYDLNQIWSDKIWIQRGIATCKFISFFF